MAKRRPIEHYVDENGCHICTSHTPNKLGYIQISVNGKSMLIHRFVYEQRFGKLPEGELVVRKCGNTKCINPEHMTTITREEAAAQQGKYNAHSLKYEVDPLTGCHICTSHAPNAMGYPMLKINKKRYLAHRYVYEKEHGKIPVGYVVRHKCDNPRCINPAHLELGTQYDNMQDKVERGRQPRGSKHGQAKLTEEDVREIRKRLAAGDGVNYLARVYGVSHKTISDIKLRRLWKHVD